MNVDLLVMVIILYILKNNSRQYWHAKNKNQNLLLLLLFINERNQCLNDKYYMNYPNHPLGNSNYIKNTSSDTSINNTEDNIINNDKGDAISKSNNTPIDTNKNIPKNTNKNTIVNKNKSTSNNKNSNGAIIKNKFIKATTKIYNKSNNSHQYWYTKISNKNLLLLLLFINERYYRNYPNHPLEKSNSIKNISKDTSIDTNKNIAKKTNKNTTVNKDNDNIIDTNKDMTIKKDNPINTNKNITKNTDKDNIINKDNYIISNTNADIPIKDTSDCIKNTSKTTSINNNEDNIINNDKSDAISKSNDSCIDTTINNNDEDTTINNSKNSNEAILKNKFIKAATKINNKPLTYRNPYKKDYKININNTFKQLPLAKERVDINELTKYFNIKTPVPLTDVKGKVPVLVGSTNITEVFHGRVTFFKPIISILKVTNEIFITSKSILPTLHSNNNNVVLDYEGFLKTRLEYLEDVIIEHSQIKCDSKHYIMFIPFSGSKELNISDESINLSNIVLKDFTLDINKSTFSVDTCLEEPSKGNKFINLYKICNLTVKVNCDVSLYRKNLIQL